MVEKSGASKPSRGDAQEVKATLQQLRTTLELYAVQHNNEYPDFATNGWAQLVNENYLVDEPRNPLSPENVAAKIRVVDEPHVTGGDVPATTAGWVWNTRAKYGPQMFAAGLNEVVHPWCTGPAEILQHARELLAMDRDKDRRLALIVIDNAVELIVKIYLTRITNSLSRKKSNGIKFPNLVNKLEGSPPTDGLAGIRLDHLKRFHILRNSVYHDPHVQTVDRREVENYLKSAELLFWKLFGVESADCADQTLNPLAEFLARMAGLDQIILETAEDLASRSRRGRIVSILSSIFRRKPYSLSRALDVLQDFSVISDKVVREIDQFWELRESMVGGQGEEEQLLRADAAEKVEKLTRAVVKGYLSQ